VKLDRRIDIQTNTQSNEDEFGEFTSSWTTTASCWADMKSLEVTETSQGVVQLDEVDIVLTIRYRPNLTTSNRIVYNSFIYDIRGIAEIGRRKYLELKLINRGESQ